MEISVSMEISLIKDQLMGGKAARHAVGHLLVELHAIADQITTSPGQLNELVILWLSQGKPHAQSEWGNVPFQFKKG